MDHRSAKKRFQLILIKPSHYGDDGYVIRWGRAPSIVLTFHKVRLANAVFTATCSPPITVSHKGTVRLNTELSLSRASKY